MTDWLDPGEVRSKKASSTDWQNGRWMSCNFDDHTTAWNVLEAIAALDEPNQWCDRCTLHPQDEIHDRGSSRFKHECDEVPLHRIWTIARIVCGKEGEG